MASSSLKLPSFLQRFFVLEIIFFKEIQATISVEGTFSKINISRTRKNIIAVKRDSVSNIPLT